MNIIAITPAQSQLVGLSVETVSEAVTLFPTDVITEQQSAETQLEPMDTQLSEDTVDNTYHELSVETMPADSSAETQALPKPSTEALSESDTTDTLPGPNHCPFFLCHQLNLQRKMILWIQRLVLYYKIPSSLL